MTFFLGPMKPKFSKLFRIVLTKAGIVLQVLKLSLEVKGIVLLRSNLLAVKRSFPRNCSKPKEEKKGLRSRQDSNLREETPMDF